MSDILKKYVCLNPFRYLDVQPNSLWVCCPSWCPTNIRVDKDGKEQEVSIPFDTTEDLSKDWFSDVANDIRKSVVDGTYRHCDHKVCPSLSLLINTGKVPSNFVTQEQFKKLHDVNNFQDRPSNILFGFDRSCNLKCPSCRSETVTNDDPESNEHKIKEFLLSSIENDFSSSIKTIMVTGSGDPIYSKLYRDYLINFDSSKYPNIEGIHVITNGVLLTEKMWNKFKAAPYIKRIEVSLDAGCKETYENVTRLNGDWDAVIENLKFLSTLTTLENLTCSMVVSKHNYKEMEAFYNLICDIFKNTSYNVVVAYRQIVYWSSGAFTIKDINNLSIFDPMHPEFNQFMIELKKVHNKPLVNHNFHHLL